MAKKKTGAPEAEASSEAGLARLKSQLAAELAASGLSLPDA